MASVARLERERAVRGRRAGVELARLGDRAAGQLRAADAGREAEVVLDPARRAGLAAERGALDDERVEPLGGAVDGGAEAGRAAADDEQVDLLASGRARARSRARGRPRRCSAARSSGPPGRRTSGSSLRVELLAGAVVPARAGGGIRRANSTSRRVVRGVAAPTISRPIPSRPAAPRGGAMKVESSRSLSDAVLEQQRAQRLALDRDVAQRLGHDRRQEDGLAREQVHLAEEAARRRGGRSRCRPRRGSRPRPRGSR